MGRIVHATLPLRPLPSCLLAAALLLHGCNAARTSARPQPKAAIIVEPIPDWQAEASVADVDRLSQLGRTWGQALAEAAKAGFKRAVAAEGNLLDPGAGLLRPAPAPGSYMCRMIELGSTSPRTRPFSTSRPTFCYVGVDSQNRLWLSKQTGALRRQGYLWEDVNPRRMVFLGALAAGQSDRAPSYGSSPGRDVGAVLERIGPLRFRLVTPRTGGGHRLEVLELTPAPVQHEE